MTTAITPHRILRSMQRRSAMMAVLLMCGLLATGCAKTAELTAVPAYDPTIYRLGTDDQIRVVVFGEDQLSNEFHIDEAGTIAIPLLGSMKAAGLTTHQLTVAITEALKDKGLLKDPSVAIEVTAYRQISILGEVIKPGQLPYQPGMTVLTAVAAAGGFTYRAVEDSAFVIRQEDGGSVTGSLQPQDFVKPGDVLKIGERLF
jgi:polysaccharide export outer membrane protein